VQSFSITPAVKLCPVGSLNLFASKIVEQLQFNSSCGVVLTSSAEQENNVIANINKIRFIIQMY
jgi:hypothetical protein